MESEEVKEVLEVVEVKETVEVMKTAEGTEIIEKVEIFEEFEVEKHEEHRREVNFKLNRKPVRVHGHDHTGMQIKQAAIAQHVNIAPDFLLFLLHDHRPNEPIGDTQTVRVTDESRFHAIADDDNS